MLAIFFLVILLLRLHNKDKKDMELYLKEHEERMKKIRKEDEEAKNKWEKEYKTHWNKINKEFHLI